MIRVGYHRDGVAAWVTVPGPLQALGAASGRAQAAGPARAGPAHSHGRKRRGSPSELRESPCDDPRPSDGVAAHAAGPGHAGEPAA
jgi:hypothetical protein